MPLDCDGIGCAPPEPDEPEPLDPVPDLGQNTKQACAGTKKQANCA
jgi:hypothetical protein